MVVFHGDIAQLEEHTAHNRKVEGSIPSIATAAE